MKLYKELNEEEKKAIDVTLDFWKYAMKRRMNELDKNFSSIRNM